MLMLSTQWKWYWLLVSPGLLWRSLCLLLARQDGKSHAGECECGVVWRLWDEDEEKRLENLARLQRSALGKPTFALLAYAHGIFWPSSVQEQKHGRLLARTHVSLLLLWLHAPKRPSSASTFCTRALPDRPHSRERHLWLGSLGNAISLTRRSQGYL
jgi:hypothetical protein